MLSSLSFYAFMCVSHSVVSESATPSMVACQAPLSLGFSREEFWSELPFPSPGDLPDPGIKPGIPPLLADSLPSDQALLYLLKYN